MNKIFAAVLCLAVPGLIFLNAWQGWRYSALSQKVDELEKQQKDLLSANRDIIGQIAYETSPARVAEKAAALGLVPADRTAAGGLGTAGRGFGAAAGESGTAAGESGADARGSTAAGSAVGVTRLRAGPDSPGGPAQ